MKRIKIPAQQITGDALALAMIQLACIVWSLGGDAATQVEKMLEVYGIKYEVHDT